MCSGNRPDVCTIFSKFIYFKISKSIQKSARSTLAAAHQFQGDRDFPPLLCKRDVRSSFHNRGMQDALHSCCAMWRTQGCISIFNVFSLLDFRCWYCMSSPNSSTWIKPSSTSSLHFSTCTIFRFLQIRKQRMTDFFDECKFTVVKRHQTNRLDMRMRTNGITVESEISFPLWYEHHFSSFLQSQYNTFQINAFWILQNFQLLIINKFASTIEAWT